MYELTLGGTGRAAVGINLGTLPLNLEVTVES